MFEIGDGSKDLEEHSPDGGGGVDTLVQHDEVDPVELHLSGQLDQVLQRSAEPVKLGDDELVAVPCSAQSVVQPGPAGQFAAGLVDEHPLTARGGQCVFLRLWVLVAGRYPSIADLHRINVSRAGVVVT